MLMEERSNYQEDEDEWDVARDSSCCSQRSRATRLAVIAVIVNRQHGRVGRFQSRPMPLVAGSPEDDSLDIAYPDRRVTGWG